MQLQRRNSSFVSPFDGHCTHGENGGVLSEHENRPNDFTGHLIENPIAVIRGDELNQIGNIEEKNQQIARRDVNDQSIGQRASHSSVELNGGDHQQVAANASDFNQTKQTGQEIIH